MTSEASKPSWFYWLTGGIVIFLLTLLDQGSKLLAVTYLKNKDDIILLPGVLQLKYLETVVWHLECLREKFLFL